MKQRRVFKIAFFIAIFIAPLLLLIFLKHITAQELTNGEIIDQDIIACKQRLVTQRPVCATAIGQKITTLFPSPEDRIKQCAKLRPILVRYCQEGLTQ